ncbi:hypothetical protein JCM19240_2717 [Vibrio maritimus]|uniref:Uncharacterized protein n=1 Tax=Vibrio maritimus TaxID=990268 RepID=A0A090TBJ7_9VIBR|nr:hypothetical protein JCM19240_2717 [Vibrio maritimus]
MQKSASLFFRNASHFHQRIMVDDSDVFAFNTQYFCFLEAAK